MYIVEFHITGMSSLFEHKFKTKKATREFIAAIENLAAKEDRLYTVNVKKDGKYIIFK